MALTPNFREEYFNALKDCVFTVAEINKFKAICANCETLRDEINGVLKMKNSILSDVDTCIDKQTCTIKKSAQSLLADDGLEDVAINYAGLCAKKRAYADEYGWHDETLASISAVLAIAEFRDLEKAMTDELGLDVAQKIMLEEKSRVLPFEQETNTTFFAVEVDFLRDLLRIKTLFETNEQLILRAQSNKTTQQITLANADGETFKCTKSAQLTLGGETYVEIVLPEDIKANKYTYYKVLTEPNCKKLVLEQDEQNKNSLDALYDKLPD